MLMQLLWRLLLACASGQALSATNTIQRETPLGMTSNDTDIINGQASCPPDCPMDCMDLYSDGYKKDGTYNVYVFIDHPKAVQVHCDMLTSGGGWTVFQRRVDGSVDFYRNWVKYVYGFGNISSDHWLGLYNMYLILGQKNGYRLRVDLVDFNRTSAYAEYSNFTIGSPLNKYSLGLMKFEGGTAGDSLSYHINMKFSTRDQDNDNESRFSCATTYHGAWWYNWCAWSNLNGNYTTDMKASDAAIHWGTWQFTRPLKSTAMMFRPM